MIHVKKQNRAWTCVGRDMEACGWEADVKGVWTNTSNVSKADGADCHTQPCPHPSHSSGSTYSHHHSLSRRADGGLCSGPLKVLREMG